MRGIRLRRLRRTAVAALGGLVVWGLLGLHFFVWPTEGPMPRHADVVLALGPPVPDRIATTERLLRDGRADTALVSVPYPTIPHHLRPFCARADVICFRPDPGTTRGEARELGRLAEEHGWDSAVVVSMTAHLSRARLIVGRCFDGAITMEPSGETPFRGWAYQYAYQTAATVKAWVLQGC